MKKSTKVVDVISLHRGRNNRSIRFARLITDLDYHFDFRGFYKESFLNPFWLLLKAWITAQETPEAKIYFIEGALVFWVGYFLKKKYPEAKLIVMIPEPAFYLDGNKGWLRQKFYQFRLKCMRNSVSHFFAISPMVAEDARKALGEKVNISIQPYFIPEISKYVNHHQPRENVILFVIERPQDTGKVKGLDHALKIFEIFSKKEPSAELWLVGSGVIDLAISHPRIYRLPHQKEMISLYNKAKIILVPSRYDAFSMVAAEAALCGVIPLVSDTTGVKSLLENDLINLVFPCDAYDDWVNCLSDLWGLSLDKTEILLMQLRKSCEVLEENKILNQFLENFEKIKTDLIGENHKLKMAK